MFVNLCETETYQRAVSSARGDHVLLRQAITASYYGKLLRQAITASYYGKLLRQESEFVGVDQGSTHKRQLAAMG